MSLQILGNGLAAMMLGHHLLNQGLDVQIFGAGLSNTPPIALVHLFAGRSFRRDPVEIQAFEQAISHWGNETLAQGHSVRRTIKAGGRLDRSLKKSEVPEAFLPRRLDESTVEYAPGFAINTQGLLQRLHQQLETHFTHKKVEELEPQERWILACGTGIDAFIPGNWQKPGGRVVLIKDENLDAIHIGHGAHIAPVHGSAAIGGRFTSSGDTLGDELLCAQRLLGQNYTATGTWSGQRCLLADDRWPVLGWMDDNRFVFSGFGSRALFWLPYAIRLAAEAIKSGENSKIPPRLSCERLSSKGPL